MCLWPSPQEADDSEEDVLERDLELEIQQNQLVMVNWMLTHRYLIIPLSFLRLEGCLGAWGCGFEDSCWDLGEYKSEINAAAHQHSYAHIITSISKLTTAQCLPSVQPLCENKH